MYNGRIKPDKTIIPNCDNGNDETTRTLYTLGNLQKTRERIEYDERQEEFRKYINGFIQECKSPAQIPKINNEKSNHKETRRNNPCNIRFIHSIISTFNKIYYNIIYYGSYINTDYIIAYLMFLKVHIKNVYIL